MLLKVESSYYVAYMWLGCGLSHSSACVKMNGDLERLIERVLRGEDPRLWTGDKQIEVPVNSKVSRIRPD